MPQVAAEKLTYEQFEGMTGVKATDLPDETFVGADRLQQGGVTQGPNYLPEPESPVGPAGVGAAVQVPLPIQFVPDNAVGILGTRPHLSIFAKVNGKLTIVGFRGNFW